MRLTQFLCWLFCYISKQKMSSHFLCVVQCVLAAICLMWFSQQLFWIDLISAKSCQCLDFWIGGIWMCRIFSDKFTNKHTLRTTMLQTYYVGVTNAMMQWWWLCCEQENSKDQKWEQKDWVAGEICQFEFDIQSNLLPLGRRKHKKPIVRTQ